MRLSFSNRLGLVTLGVSALILILTGVAAFRLVTSENHDFLVGKVFPLLETGLNRNNTQLRAFIKAQNAQFQTLVEIWFAENGMALARGLAEELLPHAENFDYDGIAAILQRELRQNPKVMGVFATLGDRDQRSAGTCDGTGVQIFRDQAKSDFAEVKVTVCLSSAILDKTFVEIDNDMNIALQDTGNIHTALLAEAAQQLQNTQTIGAARLGYWLVIIGAGGFVTLCFFLLFIVRRLMATLAVLEEQSQLILNSASDGIVGMGGDGRTIFINPAVVSLLGYTAKELLGQPLHNLAHYAYSNGHEHLIEDCPVLQTTQDGRPQKITDDILWRKDGTPIPVEYTTTPMIQAGELVGAVMVFRDVSEQRATAMALYEANKEQQAIFDAASIGISFIQNRVIQKGNRQFYQLLGYDQTELIGQTTYCLYPDAKSYEEVGLAYADLDRGEIHQRIQEIRRKDGSLFWCRMSGSAIVPGDLSRGVVWALADVTQEHEAMASLRHGKAMAESAAKMKADFLANMSHELRTPMNAIIGLSHLILDTELTPRQQDCLQRIHDASQSLLGILNNLIDLSRIEAGRMTLDQRAFSLTTVLNAVASDVVKRSHSKGLKFSLVVDLAVPDDLIGDSSSLEKILINLTDNAVKFTELGEVSLQVGVREESDRNLLLHFAVRDTGLGLTEEQQHQLFQNFSQMEAATTRRFAGIGLGLVISKLLAELMGGEMGVDSVPGQGSTFWFTVRLDRGPTKTPAHLKTTSQLLDQVPAAVIVTLPEVVDMEQVKVIRAKLATRLAEEDFEANRIFETNASLLRASLKDEDYRELEDGIRHLDFEKALSVLTRTDKRS